MCTNQKYELVRDPKNKGEVLCKWKDRAQLSDIKRQLQHKKRYAGVVFEVRPEVVRLEVRNQK